MDYYGAASHQGMNGHVSQAPACFEPPAPGDKRRVDRTTDKVNDLQDLTLRRIDLSGAKEVEMI